MPFLKLGGRGALRDRIFTLLVFAVSCRARRFLSRFSATSAATTGVHCEGIPEQLKSGYWCVRKRRVSSNRYIERYFG